MTVWRELRFLAACNLLIGASWLVGIPTRTRSEVYNPAKALLDWLPFYPMRAYGLVAVAIGLFLVVAGRNNNPMLLTLVLGAGVTYWAWWSLMFAAGSYAGTFSVISAVLTLAFTRRHWVLFPGRSFTSHENG